MEEGDTKVRGGQSFGKFMAKYHDLERAYKALRGRHDRLYDAMYSLRVEAQQSMYVLRLAGYKERADAIAEELLKINEVIEGYTKP